MHSVTIDHATPVASLMKNLASGEIIDIILDGRSIGRLIPSENLYSDTEFAVMTERVRERRERIRATGGTTTTEELISFIHEGRR